MNTPPNLRRRDILVALNISEANERTCAIGSNLWLQVIKVQLKLKYTESAESHGRMATYAEYVTGVWPATVVYKCSNGHRLIRSVPICRLKMQQESFE
jgi:hypothetical protein